MKIIFSPSKEMNLDNLENKENDINFIEVNEIIKFIKNVNEKETSKIFKTKNSEIYKLNQNINVLSKPAIELYNGISFRQISNKKNKNLNNLLILSALYGASYAFDYISFYRYDYTMKYANVNKKAIYRQINKLLKNEDVIYNLASNEFSNNIEHDNMLNFVFYIKKDNNLINQSTISKKMRGLLLDYIVNLDDMNNLNEILLFDKEGFTYNKELSNTKDIVFVKE